MDRGDEQANNKCGRQNAHDGTNSHTGSVVYWRALYLRLDAPGAQKVHSSMLDPEGGCACTCSRRLGTGQITAPVTATVGSRSQGGNGDWSDMVRRRRARVKRLLQDCSCGRIKVHCCFVLSAHSRAPPCKLHHFHHNHTKPIAKTSLSSCLSLNTHIQRPPISGAYCHVGRYCQMHR